MEQKKIIDYIVIAESRLETLQKNVLEKLNEGYVLQGGATKGGEYSSFIQTLIKYED